MTAPGPDWAEQARRLAAGIAAEHGPAVAGWVEQARWFTAGLAAEPGAPTSSEAPAGECTSCPVCVALAALRGRRPDVVEALADVLATAAAALAWRLAARAYGWAVFSGLWSHVLRDAADGGTPLLWPLSPRERVPRGVFPAGLAALVAGSVAMTALPR